MANGNGKSIEVVLKDVRLSFAYLFRPYVNENEEGKTSKKFKASFLIDKSNKKQIAAVEAAIDEAMASRWGDDEKKWPKLKADKFCFRDGDDEDYDGYAGMMYVSASNSKRPTVVGRQNEPLVEEDGKPYSGCRVNAVVRVWAQDNKFGKRVNASLEAVQFYKDGDAFGAAPVNVDEAFEKYEDEDEDDRGSRRSSRRSDDEDDGGSRRSSRRSSRDDDEDDRGSRRSSRRRDEEEEEEDDRSSRRSRRSRDDEDDD